MTNLSGEQQQDHLLDKLGVFTLHGRDKLGRRILLILGKSFPARSVTPEALKGYLERRVYPELAEERFSVVYAHAGVRKSESCPGLSNLRSFLDAFPADIKAQLHTVYFLHPGLQDRLFLATFGRLLFPAGLYGKVKYVSRLEYLWEHVRRSEVDMPDFVYDFDEELEEFPSIDYGVESDHPRMRNVGPSVQHHYYNDNEDSSTIPCYSMRCIA
ncbi:hypothetical protein MLD38_034360 [Melastoma candidum]|uniref:Uncharacterized protein n=1 Tax=Melastoma candidum TaxID=119954 RepID=A0ACB9MAC2_9MYRT|nr:hypothetical protein MLD38_034360 [Melastoma candidum]